MMNDAETEQLQCRVARALGINPDFPPMMLITLEGEVRRLLTAFGDAIADWPDTLRAVGIPCKPDPNTNGGWPQRG